MAAAFKHLLPNPVFKHNAPDAARLLNPMRQLAMMLVLFSANAGAIETHCAAHEQAIFSCTMAKSSKVVSLCASTILSKEQGTLAYRFGRIGKVELEFPASPQASLRQFRYAHYFRPDVDRTEVSFSIGKIGYTVFDYYDGEERPKESRGIRVSARGADSHQTALLCAGKIRSELFKLESLVPCDNDNALASCD